MWQASQLALDAFVKFNQQTDREAAVRLLKRLAANYPTSKLAKLVPELVGKIEVPAAPAAAPARPTPGGSTPPVATATPARSGQATPNSAVKTDSANTPVSQASGRAAGIATIKSIRRSVLPDAVRVVIELDAEVSFHQERIPDPSRVFVDLPGTRAAATLTDQTMRFESDADIVRQVRIGRHPNNTTRVVLDANGVSSYSVYPLYDPYRLVVDCVRATAAPTATTSASTNATSTTNTSHTSLPASTAPTAIAAAAMPAKPVPSPPLPPPRRDPLPIIARRAVPMMQRNAPSGSPQRTMLLALARLDAASVPPVLATRPLPPLPLSSPIAAPPAKALDVPAVDSASAAPPPASSASASAPAKSPGGLSIARQLGLGVSRIVIDPGHGGHDSGAKGKGVTESELVLDVALRLEKLLQKVPGVEVILTRRTDDFVELPERTAMANREGADLFLSIHANASTSALAHGIETYFLNFATNLSAAAVAARENANSTQAMGALPDLVKAIALNTKVDESHELAGHVQTAMIERLRPANKTVKDLGVKQAPFVVLIGAAMPSVLAEISFVTNPQEARLLKSNAYRQHISEALFDGVRKYQTSLKGATTVTTQR